jgi:SSS family solute:Na+ symporter
VLLFEQTDPVAALVIVGLLAAAISTADSQIFALGTELRSLLPDGTKNPMLVTRIAIMGFGLAALVFAIVSGDQFALLAKLSFKGTAMMGPMILCAILSKKTPHQSIAWLSGTALMLFIGTLVKVGGKPLVPKEVHGVNTYLVLMAIVTAYSLALCWRPFAKR